MSEPHRADPGFARYETRRDVEASLAARRELGPEFEDEVAAGLAERVEALAAMRTAELRVQAQGLPESEADRSSRTQSFVLGIVSVGAGIPITAVASATTEGNLGALLIAWAGIVGVNVAHTLSRRPRRR